jgi:UDP-N-acetylglucosamine acyltransferase
VTAVIHSTAIIDPSAKIGKDVAIGPYTVIGPRVEIGDGTWIGPHVVINGPTKIGQKNRIYQFSSIGEVTQDLKYNGEETFLEIGDHNIIREFCTVNRGSVQDNSITKIGSHNLLMAYVHIAHDCIIGNHVVFSNNASLAGHVKIEDHVVLGGFSGVFQFCRVGAHSFISTNSVVIKDVPPYVKVSGYYAKPFGLNTVGLQRRGFTTQTITELKRAYKIVYRNGLTVANALVELKQITVPEVQTLTSFIEASSSGIVR